MNEYMRSIIREIDIYIDALERDILFADIKNKKIKKGTKETIKKLKKIKKELDYGNIKIIKPSNNACKTQMGKGE